jgi:hypothetical protein
MSETNEGPKIATYTLSQHQHVMINNTEGSCNHSEIFWHDFAANWHSYN